MALRGTNQDSGRHYNRRIVLETIRQHGPIARKGDIIGRIDRASAHPRSRLTEIAAATTELLGVGMATPAISMSRR